MLCGLNRGDNVRLESLSNRGSLGGFGEVLSLDRGSGLNNGGSEGLERLGLARLGNGLMLDRAHKLGSLGGSGAAGTDVFLGLGAVLADILLHQAGGLRSALTSQITELVGLGVDDLLGIDNLLVDDFPVADVHQGSKVCGSHSNHGQAPEGNEADQPVASESSSEGLRSN